MRFFLPGATDETSAEENYGHIRGFIEKNIGPLDPRRFYSLAYEHNGKPVSATVGAPDPLERQLVVAIFRSAAERGPYYVCTPNRGVIRGDPILAGSSSARAVEFERA